MGQEELDFARQDIPAEPSLQLKEELTGEFQKLIFNCQRWVWCELHLNIEDLAIG